MCLVLSSTIISETTLRNQRVLLLGIAQQDASVNKQESGHLPRGGGALLGGVRARARVLVGLEVGSEEVVPGVSVGRDSGNHRKDETGLPCIRGASSVLSPSSSSSPLRRFSQSGSLLRPAP